GDVVEGHPRAAAAVAGDGDGAHAGGAGGDQVELCGDDAHELGAGGDALAGVAGRLDGLGGAGEAGTLGVVHDRFLPVCGGRPGRVRAALRRVQAAARWGAVVACWSRSMRRTISSCSGEMRPAARSRAMRARARSRTARGARTACWRGMTPVMAGPRPP